MKIPKTKILPQIKVGHLLRVFNIGNSKPINLINYIKAIENELGIEAKKKVNVFTTW